MVGLVVGLAQAETTQGMKRSENNMANRTSWITATQTTPTSVSSFVGLLRNYDLISKSYHSARKTQYGTGFDMGRLYRDITGQTAREERIKTVIFWCVVSMIVGIIMLIFGSNKTWLYKYGKNTIVVKNTLLGCELIINEQLQDKKTTSLATQGTLQGKLESGEEVMVHLGSGLFGVDCNLRINNKIIPFNK